MLIDTAAANAKLVKWNVVSTEVTISNQQVNFLSNVERIHFKDKYVVLDLEPGTSGYKAALLAVHPQGQRRAHRQRSGGQDAAAAAGAGGYCGHLPQYAGSGLALAL